MTEGKRYEVPRLLPDVTRFQHVQSAAACASAWPESARHGKNGHGRQSPSCIRRLEFARGCPDLDIFGP